MARSALSKDAMKHGCLAKGCHCSHCGRMHMQLSTVLVMDLCDFVLVGASADESAVNTWQLQRRSATIYKILNSALEIMSAQV